MLIHLSQSGIVFFTFFLEVIFPITLALIYILFGVLFYQYKHKFDASIGLSVRLTLTGPFLLTVGIYPLVDWMFSVQVGIVLIISLLELELALNLQRNQLISKSIRVVTYGLSFLALISQLFINIFAWDGMDVGKLGLPAFWAGILLFISCILKIFWNRNFFQKKKTTIFDLYHLTSIFIFLPISFWMMVNFKEAVHPILVLPFLFGLLWIGIFVTNLIHQKSMCLGRRLVKRFSIFFGGTSIIGLGLLIFSFLSTLSIFVDQVTLRIMGSYVFLFSLALFVSFFYSGEKDKKKGSKNEKISHLSQDLLSKEDLIDEIKKYIIERIEPDNFFLYLFDPGEKLYKPQKSSNLDHTNIFFAENSTLSNWLIENENVKYVWLNQQLPNELGEEFEKFKLIAADALLPIRVDEYLLGWFLLTFQEKEKQRERINNLLPTIDEFGHLYKRMEDHMIFEQRERNFNILSKLVKGVNYTLALNDIYELISAQTSKVVSSDIFYVILKEENTQDLRFDFCVFKDERDYSKEDNLLATASLESKVVKSGQGVIANYYPEFCDKSAAIPHSPEIHNAMIIPLNTADKTIGCLFLGRINEQEFFSQDQLDLLQSIADLVAGAIEKARLLVKTEQHVLQLSRLNDVVRKLSSIKTINELLNSILDFSTDLIEFDESRLILLDQNTNNQFYQEFLGGNQALGKHPRILFKPHWFEEIENKPDLLYFDSISQAEESIRAYYENLDTKIHSILILPLVINQKVYGVLELLNRKNQHYFSENDKQLMKSYAAQAAITWENALLYQQTDRELAERVEELSIMQKIDRELNVSLDTKTTLAITLSWAMKWVKADAGWIGLVDENKISAIQYSGYDKSLVANYPQEIPIELLTSEIYTDQLIPQRFNNPGNMKFHPMAVAQFIAPVYREKKLVAILFLEKIDDFSLTPNQTLFLSRLGDHASIAITNCQLYEEIQKANTAKSEFVSLVAHELKNPMTSIKGYTELLATGASGALSDTQINFLSIIRNNTERMNALVSDLNDLTKIETGNIHLEMKPTRLEELMVELERTLKKQLHQKNQTFHIELEENLPPILIDENRFLQVLINLVSNANKYTQESGEISLIVEETSQIGEDTFDRPISHIAIKDNGFGISEEDQEYIFQKFFRSEDPDVRAVSGTGLGLNITRSLLEMMGGKIWFESAKGKGTTFHVVVPFAENENP